MLSVMRAWASAISATMVAGGWAYLSLYFSRLNQTGLTNPKPIRFLHLQPILYFVKHRRKPTAQELPSMLYTHATIITVDGARRIIDNGAIRVDGDTIADIGKTAVLKERYPDDEEYDLSGRIIIPGLISTHMHTAQTLLRGTADDLELVSWLCERIWVLQGNFTEADGYAAARLSIGEMLKSGTTCFLESMVSIYHGRFWALANAVSLLIGMALMV